MNRDAFVQMVEAMRDAGVEAPNSPEGEEFDPNGPADDGNAMGMPETDLTLAIDVSGHLEAKRAALRCHRSQISDTSFFLEMPDEVFAMAFGTEWFIEHDAQPPVRRGWIFEPT
jgi:LmbE family N-acetylglucosaminyl deacetylase